MFDVGGIVQLGWHDRYSHRARLMLRRSQEFDIGNDTLVVEHAHAAHPWRGLLQKLQPFSADRGLEILKTRDIAAWTDSTRRKSVPARLRRCQRRRLEFGRCFVL
jgi:hypothetical protein